MINSNPNSPSVTSTTTGNNLNQLESVIDNLGDRLEEQFFTFINTNNNAQSTNVSNDVLIFPGVPVPTGFIGKVQDVNVNFGTIAGTVKLAIMDFNAKNIISYYQLNISASSNGLNQLVLNENQCLCLLGQVAGAGTVTVLATGILKQKTGLIRNQTA